MTFNLRQLDRLSYDDVEPIMYDYIEEITQLFIASPEGQAYESKDLATSDDRQDLKDASPMTIKDKVLSLIKSTDPEPEETPPVGYWIARFIDYGYIYEEVTLPQMTQQRVKSLMENTLPRKVTISEPSDAADAIPELVAFWQ